MVARTAHWLTWYRHFGPASSSDPKIKDKLGRYSLAVFTGGINIGPYEAAKHIAGVTARELSMVRNRHITLKKLNAPIADVVNAFAELDVVKAWGDGSTVAADSTQVDTYIDNLLAETSIRYGGRLSSTTLMRRLRSNSRKNRIYKAFREVGRSVRTVALLRYLADPALGARVTAATNKVESYNGFSKWLGFGGVLADNDPEEQEKLIKFNTLLANLVVFHNALDISDVVRQLVAEGWSITADQLGQIAPYLRAHISRFGAYATDELRHRPGCARRRRCTPRVSSRTASTSSTGTSRSAHPNARGRTIARLPSGRNRPGVRWRLDLLRGSSPCQVSPPTQLSTCPATSTTTATSTTPPAHITSRWCSAWR
ncbi:Tn3 family transposase [Nonomuraea sp. B1E8]|uniref:Tn3 family transposase n=1 Tax=Nonomuraea sp. B1E8 TaxID=3153575 RepID=UPI00325E61C9